MDYRRIVTICFSPTGTTAKILSQIAAGINESEPLTLNLTPYAEARETVALQADDLAIIGVPVYSGRVPLEAIARLERVKANGNLAVIVVVYGNRQFDDALIELKNVVSGRGFLPFAGGAFIAEHSFSSAQAPIAVGRPDPEDLNLAKAFGERIRTRLKDITAIEDVAELTVSGNIPYRKRKEPLAAAPISNKEKCIKCKQCITVCPVGAITEMAEMETDNSKCILCNACIRICPTRARTITAPGIIEIAEQMSAALQTRKTPDYFM